MGIWHQPTVPVPGGRKFLDLERKCVSWIAHEQPVASWGASLQKTPGLCITDKTAFVFSMQETQMGPDVYKHRKLQWRWIHM